MRIGCLQFAPRVGDVSKNLDRADAILSRADLNALKGLDFLVLPEMAFTGSSTDPRQSIMPFAEPAAAGITSLWARTAALKYGCTVVAGYPEKVDLAIAQPTSPEFYSSSIMVSPHGETLANHSGGAPDERDPCFSDRTIYHIGRVSVGQCSDLGKVAVMSMAWETAEEPRDFSRRPNEPDMDSLTCWVRRLEPLIRAETSEEIIVILCNRTGVEGHATYAGSSAVLGIKGGEVLVYGILGRNEKELLFVDTDIEPIAKLVHRPDAESDSNWDADKTSSDETEAQQDSPITPDTSDKGSESVYLPLARQGLEYEKSASKATLQQVQVLDENGTAQEVSKMGQPIRPRIQIPPAMSARSHGAKADTNSPEALKSALSRTSASSSATIRPLDKNSPSAQAIITSNQRWPSEIPSCANLSPPKTADAVPITPFEDLTPISAACFWPTSQASPPTNITAGSTTPARERTGPMSWKYPRNTSGVAVGTGRGGKRAFIRPDTPAVARHQFRWPSSSQPASYGATSKLRKEVERDATISQRPESPKSRHASSPDLRQQHFSVMSPKNFEVAANHLEGIARRAHEASADAPTRQANRKSPERRAASVSGSAAVDDRKDESPRKEEAAGSIVILASPSVLCEKLSARCPNRASTQAAGSTTSSKSRSEKRGRTRERLESADGKINLRRAFAEDHADLSVREKQSPRTASGTLRRVQTHQAIRAAYTSEYLRNGDFQYFRTDFEKDGAKVRRQSSASHPRKRSLSQAVIPSGVQVNARRANIASWPISSEDLRISAAIIHKRLIDSFAKT
ncbi:hypothetical protein PWT90_04555 [Aphanocladium album]|nr:hypothetical protein PWT90_04555 [Aphanocladium album]